MDTERLTHTAASLAALAPRDLDALAHFHVFNRGAVGMRDGEPVVIPTPAFDGPHYSASLDAAALLEAELARRDLMAKYNMSLCEVVGFDITLRPDNYSPTIQGGEYYDPIDPVWLTPIIHATAAQRTIAAILAANLPHKFNATFTQDSLA